MTRLSIIAVVLVVSSPIRAEEPTATPTVYTAAQAAAGRTAYQSVCINCHTEALTGRKGEAGERPPLDSLPADVQNYVQVSIGKIPPLAGPQFMARWGARTTTELSERIKIAISGFPPKDVNERTSLLLAAYFLQVNGAIPGAEELTASTAVTLTTIVPPEATSERQ